MKSLALWLLVLLTFSALALAAIILVQRLSDAVMTPRAKLLMSYGWTKWDNGRYQRAFNLWQLALTTAVRETLNRRLATDYLKDAEALSQQGHPGAARAACNRAAHYDMTGLTTFRCLELEQQFNSFP